MTAHPDTAEAAPAATPGSAQGPATAEATTPSGAEDPATAEAAPAATPSGAEDTAAAQAATPAGAEDPGAPDTTASGVAAVPAARGAHAARSARAGGAMDEAVGAEAPAAALHAAVNAWFAANARDLPWRRPDAGAWGVLVSEFMLQQTPVSRVLPVYEEWLARWPAPEDLAAEPPGEAVRAWGRLGYPRRALRLHAAAVAVAERHGGRVPDDHERLLALPGVGEYTAAAVASFAYGRRHPVLDTNVRRVLARAVTGVALPPTATTAAERRLARELLPPDEPTAARWAAATMELGALVCTARTPSCGRCPIAGRCAWRAAGAPAHDGPPRRGQGYAGTDRQVRGRLLAVLREAEGAVDRSELDAVWDEPAQRARALAALVADGLVESAGPGAYRLPTR